jgi:hypothetical protein
MLSLSEIAAQLQQTWSAACPADVPTQFPGVPLDAEGLSAWCEFWVTQASEAPVRPGNFQSAWLLIDVHCFARGPEKRRVFELADAVRAGLAHQNIPLGAAGDASSQGLLRIYEATTRDLTRELLTEPKLPLQHLAVSLAARAEIREG